MVVRDGHHRLSKTVVGGQCRSIGPATRYVLIDTKRKNMRDSQRDTIGHPHSARRRRSHLYVRDRPHGHAQICEVT